MENFHLEYILATKVVKEPPSKNESKVTGCLRKQLLYTMLIQCKFRYKCFKMLLL